MSEVYTNHVHSIKAKKIGSESYILNGENIDSRYLHSSDENIAKRMDENEFTETNIFSKQVTTSQGIKTDGNIYIAKGSQISFLNDGEVTITSGANGYPIFNGIPTVIANGAIYNIGDINADTDLSGIVFDGDETIVQTCELWFNTGLTLYNITFPSNLIWIDYEDGNMPQLLSKMKYRIIIRKEIDTLIASISHYYSIS